jgi:integrase
VACIELKDAMQLGYLTGQRPADVLDMRFPDIQDGALQVQQNKTGTKLRILTHEGEKRNSLGELVKEIQSRSLKKSFQYIIATPDGEKATTFMLRNRFENARNCAAEKAIAEGNECLAERIRAFQFRDIRRG